MANRRIKTGQEPGDLPKREKQMMLEKGIRPHPKATLAEQRQHARGYKKYVLTNERAILKERTKVRIRQDLED